MAKKHSLTPLVLAAALGIGGVTAYQSGLLEQGILYGIDKFKDYKVGLEDNPKVMLYGGRPNGNNIGGCGMGLGAVVGAYLIGSALTRRKEKNR